MSLARGSAFVLLPVVLLLERFSYYGMRALLYSDLMAPGTTLDPASTQTHVQYVTWLIAVTPPIGGLVAIALMPRWTLVAGIAVTILGYALLAALGSGSFAAFGVLAVGLGLLKPAIFATAALAGRDPGESARGAIFVALYAAINAGSFAGSAVSSALPKAGDVHAFGLFSIAGACLMSVALLLAIGVAIAPRFGEVRQPPDPPFTGRGEVGSLAVIALGVPALLAMALAQDLQFEPFFRSGTSEYMRWIFYLNPAAVLAISVLLFGALAAAAYAGTRIPALYIAAAGMAVVVLGCAPLAAVGAGDEIALAGGFASIALIAVGEALFYPLALSRLAAGTHPRSAALMVSIWLVLASVLSQLVGLAMRWGTEQTGSPLTGVLLVAAAVCTLLAAAGMIFLQRLGAPALWASADAPVPEGS